MSSKSKDNSLFSEHMLIKQIILAHFTYIKCNINIRISEL